MSKWVPEVIGGLEVAGGVALGIVSGFAATPLAGQLIAAGVGTMISGLGTLLSKGPAQGFSTTMRNPTAPWSVVYGRERVGGTVVYMNLWPPPGNGAGGNDQILDMVVVLAAHSIESVDAVLFDMQRVQIDTTAKVSTGQDGSGAMSAGPYAGTGTSFTPVQQNIGPGTGGIPKIQRSQGVVTITLDQNIPYLIEGDRIQVAGIGNGYDTTLNGTFQVEQILVQTTGSLIFTVLNGGADTTVTGQGQVNTLWADYGRTVYFEPMLGGQSQGQSFNGMVFGTPIAGDMGDIVSPAHTGGEEGQDQPNPWTTACSLLGKSAVFLRLQYNATYYKGGLPQISFLVHGKNDIYDPRTSTSGYSENAALCIADFLADTTWGYKAVYGTEIPYANLTAAANVCDEAVPLAYSLSSPALTEPAYALNGQFTLETKRGEILQNMLTACAGRLTYVAGQYVIWPGSWVGNTFAIGANPGGGIIPLPSLSQLAAGTIKWSPTVSIRDLYNGVKGTYVSQANKWQATDFPPYCQDANHGYSGPSLYGGDINLAYDNGDRRWLDIQLPFTISYSTAQRLAKIELLRRRTSGGNGRGTGTLVLNATAYQIATLDLIQITWAPLNWTAKQFEVIQSRLAVREGADGEGPRLVCEIDIVEVDSSIFNWSTTEELSPEGYIQPVIPGVGPFSTFITEAVPGYDVPFPWEPAYVLPLVGDSLYPGTVAGAQDGTASFGLMVQYGTDASGNATASMEVSGVAPPNQLSASVAPPQIVSAVAGTSGHLAPGTYLIAMSATTGSPAQNTPLGTPFRVTIPAPSPVANTGSIALTLGTWPLNAVTVEVYVAADETEDGYYFQESLSSGATSTTLTDFDQTNPGAPDSSLDHLAIAWKQVINSGIWAQQVQAVTSNTVTIAGPGMTANMYAGRTLRADAKTISQIG